MKWGDSAPADAPTPPKAVCSLDSRMRLLCYFFSLFFLFSLLLEAFLHLGSVMGLPALSLQSPSPLMAFLTSPFPPASPVAVRLPSLPHQLP